MRTQRDYWIDVDQTEDGIPLIREGNYGHIALRHELRPWRRMGRDGAVEEEPCLFYRLSGCNLRSGRFPAEPKWNDKIRALPHARYSRKGGYWRVRLIDEEEARTVLDSLIKVLKQSIGRRNRMARENRIKAAEEHKKQLAEQAAPQAGGEEKLSTPAVENPVGNTV